MPEEKEAAPSAEMGMQIMPGDRWVLIVQKPGDQNLTLLQSETITEGPAMVIAMLSACINNICRMLLKPDKPLIHHPGPFFIPRRNGG